MNRVLPVKRVLPVAALMVAIVLSSGEARAQSFGGFLTAGTGGIDYLVTREYRPLVSGGVLWSIGDTRVSLGAQVDWFVSIYPNARGGPFAQFDLAPRRSTVVPFVVGGYFAADGGGMWMLGAGVDVRPAAWGAAGLRLSVQDVFRNSIAMGWDQPSYRRTFHEPSFQAGFVFR